MAERFKKLDGANGWPGLSTVAPFDFEVTFSPYLWTAGTQITLCNVPWDSTYADVVAFDNDAARNQWLDSHAGARYEFDTEFRILPGEAIKLPIPFDALQNFNYLYIDFPAAPVDHDGGGVHRFCYFVEDVAYVAPSTTSCIITVDEWTTHASQVDVSYIELERGHAPVAAIPATTFLANPIGNMRHLATPDDTTGAPARAVKHTATDVLNAGPLFAMLVMTCDPSTDLGTKYAPGWRTAVTNECYVEGAITLATIAVDPIDVPILLNNIDAQAPQVKPSIVALFLVPRRLLRVVTWSTFCGVQIAYINEQPALDSLLTLTVDKFAYPTEYAGLAKLYTSPYAAIEVVDSNGRTSTIRVEDTTGQLELSVAASVVAPMMGIDAHVVGIGDSGGALSWRNFAEHSFAAYGRWEQALMHFDFPTYAILQDASQSYDYRTHWGRQQQQAAIDSSYAVQLANAGATRTMAYENTARNAARLGQQQASDRAQLSIGIGYDTQLQIADENKMIFDVSADANLAAALYQQQQNTVALSTSQTAATSAMAVTRATKALDVAQQQEVMTNVNSVAGVVDSAVSVAAAVVSGGASAAAASTAAAAEAAQTATTMGAVSGSVGIASQITSAIYAGGTAHANTMFAGLDLDAATLSQQQTAASYSLQLSNNRAAYDKAQEVMYVKHANAQQRLREGYRITHALQTDSLNQQQSAASAIMSGDNAVVNGQADRVYNLSQLASSTAKAQGEAAIQANIRSAALGTPIIVNGGSGRSTDITRPQAVWARVVTQDAGSIAQAGDAFLRYGYRYGGRQWQVTTLTPMAKFSYWQGRLRMFAPDINCTSRRIIEGIFESGVTVWKRPEEIGRTSIYENGVTS